MEVETHIDNFNKSFFVGEIITGNVTIKNRERYTDLYYCNVTLRGFFSIKNTKTNPPATSEIQFFTKKIKIAENSKIVQGDNNVFPFKFPLVQEGPNVFYESYHGVVVSIVYEMISEVKTPRDLVSAKREKITMYVPGIGIKDIFGRKRVPYHFSITPETVEIITKENKKMKPEEIPKFNIECHIDSINCDINKPFDGYCMIHNSSIAIKSVELQFMRSEKVYVKGSEPIKEFSEIQNLQIGDGDVIKEVEIPLFMLFPRVFSCASMDTPECSVGFEMNVVIVLVNGVIIVQSFPINLWRS